MSQTTFIISDVQSSARLDITLSQYFKLSRNFFHHLISRGKITVKSKILKKSYLCKKGDIIQIADMNRFDDDSCLAESPQIELPILYETQDYAVIYKPKGVYSHPTSLWEISQESVVGFLYHHYGSIPSIGTFVRAGLLHRLDRGTDGLMIVALSERGLAHFRQLFHDKSSADTLEAKDAVPLKKRYRCRVKREGMFKTTNILTNLPYLINNPVCAKVPGAVEKDAITRIGQAKRLKDIDGNTMIEDAGLELELEILTGRTHQIRIHCAKVLKSPIVGDTLYGSKRQSGPMMLTAFKLCFLDPSGLTQTIELLSPRHDSKSTRDFALNGVRQSYDPSM